MKNKHIENILAHYGIIGMHWGVTKSEDHVSTRAIGSKKVSEMSNEELKAITQRLNLEKQYKDLNPSSLTRGSRAVGNFLKTFGKIAGAVGTITTLAAAGKKAMDFYNGGAS